MCEITALIVGVCFIPIIWMLLKSTGAISDRMLPSPVAVLYAYRDIEPNIFIHCFSTAARLFVGFFAGTAIGILTGIVMNYGTITRRLIFPTLQAVRAIPAAASVPFFLLWFGFSETGRLLLVIVAVATNVAIASFQILDRVPEKFAVFFRSFDIKSQNLVRSYALPMIAAHILPTLRFSLAVVIGAQTISELLGAQIGLGYVIQSARATFSLPALFLAMMLLGALTAVSDALLCRCWKHLLYWENGKTL